MDAALLSMLLQGGIVGFAIAAPVGPIGLLCVTRTLEQGPVTGVTTGLGAASADAVYGLIVVLGFGAAAGRLLDHADILKIAGGLLLIWLGTTHLVRKGRSPSVQEATVPQASGRGPATAFGSAFALTLTNPMTILSFAGAVAALTKDTAVMGGAVPGTAVVVGVFLGSMAWWFTLVGIVTAVGTLLSQTFITAIQVLSSTTLVGIGGYAVVRGLTG